MTRLSEPAYDPHHTELPVNDDTPIGRVVATERDPTTTGQVRFWLEPDVELKPFDFVRLTGPENTKRNLGECYAIIHEIKQVSDEPSPLSSFVSADFGDSQITPRMSRVVANLRRSRRSLQHTRH